MSDRINIPVTDKSEAPEQGTLKLTARGRAIAFGTGVVALGAVWAVAAHGLQEGAQIVENHSDKATHGPAVPGPEQEPSEQLPPVEEGHVGLAK